jgi:hypothetical protein
MMLSASLENDSTGWRTKLNHESHIQRSGQHYPLEQVVPKRFRSCNLEQPFDCRLDRVALYAIHVFGTFPPLAASWRMTLVEPNIHLDEPFVFPNSQFLGEFLSTIRLLSRSSSFNKSTIDLS